MTVEVVEARALVAALSGDDEELARLVGGMHPSERRALAAACDRVADMVADDRYPSVQPEWCRERLTLQQQSVLLLAARGPDGIAKTHPCKDVQRAYRGTVLVAARYGRMLRWGEPADSFMGLADLADDARWAEVVERFYESVDALPHHFLMHLLHGAEIVAYRHPDGRFRDAWWTFYATGCHGLHLEPESRAAMDDRLSDWNRESWAPAAGTTGRESGDGC